MLCFRSGAGWQYLIANKPSQMGVQLREQSMSTVPELDLAIQKVDALLTQLQVGSDSRQSKSPAVQKSKEALSAGTYAVKGHGSHARC